MILEVADYIDGITAEPPPDLKRAWKCKSWGVLPKWGGLEDQRLGELERMSLCLNVYNAMKMWMRCTNQAEFPTKYPDLWKIVSYVFSLRGQRRKNG